MRAARVRSHCFPVAISPLKDRGKWHFDFFDTPRRVSKRLPNIFFLQVRISGQNISVSVAGGNEPTIVPTVTRMPRRHGLPPITSGFRVIRSRSMSCTIEFYRYGRATPAGRDYAGVASRLSLG